MQGSSYTFPGKGQTYLWENVLRLHSAGQRRWRVASLGLVYGLVILFEPEHAKVIASTLYRVFLNSCHELFGLLLLIFMSCWPLNASKRMKSIRFQIDCEPIVYPENHKDSKFKKIVNKYLVTGINKDPVALLGGQQNI